MGGWNGHALRWDSKCTGCPVLLKSNAVVPVSRARAAFAAVIVDLMEPITELRARTTVGQCSNGATAADNASWIQPGYLLID